MKITKIELKDFRCFDDFQMGFPDEYNTHVIIAENMVGKSAVMAALRIASNTYTTGLKSEWQLEKTDHRILGANVTKEITSGVSIKVEAIVSNVKGEKQISTWLKYKTKPSGERTKVKILDGIDPRKVSKEINDQAGKGTGLLPLFSFIGTEYIHVESSDTVNWDVTGNSIDGYKDCWEDKSIKKHLFKWIGRMDNILNEMLRKPLIAEVYKDAPANAIHVFQTAVKSILPDVKEIVWSEDLKEPIVKLANNEIRQFSVLSDGYRYLILLAGELATRAFILNKHLGPEVLSKIHGLVLIDEFGIHLHPTLQNDALTRLQNTFPNVQFIITTHSPLLLNGLKKEQVHIITIDDSGKRIISNPDEDIIGLGANEILTKIFGLPTTMDKEFISMNEEYTSLFRKKSSNEELNSNEVKRFEHLSRALSHLRLDPALEITTEDPITQIVKEELAKRNSLESFTKEIRSPESLKLEVDEILNKLFSKNNY